MKKQQIPNYAIITRRSEYADINALVLLSGGYTVNNNDSINLMKLYA